LVGVDPQEIEESFSIPRWECLAARVSHQISHDDNHVLLVIFSMHLIALFRFEAPGKRSFEASFLRASDSLLHATSAE
jgi:hypothetical protein